MMLLMDQRVGIIAKLVLLWGIIPLASTLQSVKLSRDTKYFTVTNTRRVLYLPTTVSPQPLLERFRPMCRMVPQTDSSSLESSFDTTGSRSITSPGSSSPVLRTPLLQQLIPLIGKTTSILVAGSVFVAIAYYRDAVTVSLFVGSISNAILSKILKRILKDPRPAITLDSSSFLSNQPADPGMPSSHAMSLGFIGTYTACYQPSWAQVFIVLYVVFSLLYRVQAKLHTWQQVVVGLTVGSCNGYGWYRLTSGDNAWGICLNEWITKTLLDETGHLPYLYLTVPIVLGAIVVGSVERRLQQFWQSTKPRQSRSKVN